MMGFGGASAARISVGNIDSQNGASMPEGQIRELVDEVVTAKMKLLIDAEVSDEEEIEGDDYLKKHVRLLSNKVKTCKRVL